MTATQDHDRDKEEGYDDNDVAALSQSAEATYVDYVYKYDGDIYVGWKRTGSYVGNSFYGDPVRYRGLDTLDMFLYDSDVTIAYTSNFQVNGYNFNNGYQIEHIDDQAAFDYDAQGGDAYGLMTAGVDYVYTDGTTVKINSTYINKRTGVTTGEYSTSPWQLMGLNENGEWVVIREFTLNSTDFTLDVDFGDAEYYGLKLVSPDDLEDSVSVCLGENIKILHTSQIGQDYKDGKYTNLRIINFVHSLLIADGEVFDVEENPLDTYSTYYGADAEDVDTYDGYIFRNSATKILSQDNGSTGFGKGVTQVSNNTDTRTITNQWNLEASSGSYYSADLLETASEEWLDAHMINSGYFYDLLPYGYRIDTSYTPVIGSTNGGWEGTISYEVIDNYEDTGRQLVIFKVEQTNDKKNYYKLIAYGEESFRSAMRVTFRTTASYDDIISGKTYVNPGAYQRLDGKTLPGAFNFDGYRANGTSTTNGKDLMNYTSALIEGEGSDAYNTLFAQASVTPSFITNYEVGAYKKVKGLSDTFSGEDVTIVNNTYVWRLYLGTSNIEGTTSGIYFIDILEDVEDETWQGTFESVNTAYAELRGAVPIVYYSTSTELNYNNISLDDESQGWTTEQPDKEDITAVIVYLGDNFTLNKLESVYVDIYMTAPSVQPAYKYAVNDFAYKTTFTTSNGASSTSQNHVNSARISLQGKIDMPETGSKEQMSFLLIGTACVLFGGAYLLLTRKRKIM